MSTIARFLVPTLAVVALLLLTQNFAPRAHAGNSASAVDLMILDGDTAELVVTVTLTLTDEDVDIGAVGVDLVETDFIDSTYMGENALVPLGASAGETVMVDVTFTLKCVDNEIEDLGLTEHTFEIHVKEVNSGAVTVTCAGEALVEFHPDPLEIAEGETKKVTATVTKLLTQLEANSRTVNLRLQEKDEDTHLGITPGDQVKLAGKKDKDEKVTFSWRFVLECRNNEIRGIQNTGKAEAFIAIEFEVDGPDYGDGTVRCKPVETSSVNSGGSHPSSIIVEEETGLAFVLNAFDGAIGVFDGATLIDTYNLPCPYVPAGASVVEPAGFSCIYQGMALRRIPQGAEIYAADFQAALVIRVVFGFGARGYPAGTPQIEAIPVGDSPTAIGIDEGTGQIYVVNNQGGSVSVIDGDTNTVTDTIVVGGIPRGIVVDSVSGIVYVSNFSGDSVHVIDTATNMEVDTIAVGDGPDGMVIDYSTNSLYVANFIDSTVSVVALYSPLTVPSSGGTVIDVGAGTRPIEIAFNPYTDRLYTANALNNTASVIDHATNELVATIPVGLTPDAVAVNGKAGIVYVANHTANTVSIISTPNPFTERIPADANCDGTVDVQDGLLALKAIGLGQEANGNECPAIGVNVEVQGPPVTEWNWGDLDCNGEIDGSDPLELVRRVAGFPPTNNDAACWGGDPIIPTYIY